MSTLKASLLFIFFYFPFLLNGQKRNLPLSTSNNFTSLKFGLSYPFFSNGSKLTEYSNNQLAYQFSNKGLNYGFFGGFGFGHYFGRKFSMDFSPILIFSKFADTDYYYENISYPIGNIKTSRIGTFHFSHLGVLLPLDFKIQTSHKLDFTLGCFLFKPFLDRHYSEFIETDYRFNPPKVYSTLVNNYKNRRSYYRGGAHIQFSYLLKEKDWQQKRISIEYYHSFTSAGFAVKEKWIVVALKKIFFQ